MKTEEWFVYLIAAGNRSYLGATTSPLRRLRQHNGFLVGGARATKALAPNWKFVLIIGGFKSKSEAYRWEKIVKSRVRGLEKRKNALMALVQGICPSGRQYEVPEGLFVYDAF